MAYTFLYDTSTNTRLGPIRDGFYLVDGLRPDLPEGIVELTITDNPTPGYDPQTHTLEYREYADIPNLLWIREEYARELTPDEISQRDKPSDICTNRQFRLALYNLYGISTSSVIENIATIEPLSTREEISIEWEYSTEIRRSDAIIPYFDLWYGLKGEGLNDTFNLAVTL